MGAEFFKYCALRVAPMNEHHMLEKLVIKTKKREIGYKEMRLGTNNTQFLKGRRPWSKEFDEK